MRFLIIALFLLFCSTAYSENINFARNTEIDLGINSNGNIVPQANIPIHWGEHFYSVLGLNVFNAYQTGMIDGAPDSNQSFNSRETVYLFAPLGYKKSFSEITTSIRLTYTYRDFESQEIGYMYMPASMGGELTALDNNITYGLHNVYAELTAEYKNEFMLINVSGKLSPWRYLNLKQKTMAKPIVATNADFNTSASNTELSYNLSGSVAFKLNRFIGVRFSGGYEFLPTEYDLQMLDYDSSTSTFKFSQGNVNEKETRITYGIQLFIPILNMSGLSPSVGYEERKSTIKNKTTLGNISAEDTSKSKEHVTSLGLTYNW